MTGHTQRTNLSAGPRWDSDWYARCTCGWQQLVPARAYEARAAAAHAKHAQAAADALAAGQVAFYVRTGSCGLCGQPGEACTCTRDAPCGCSDLHPLGSGLGPDAYTRFRTDPVEQDEAGLW